MVDFINEVEEELRKDKYNVLLRKFGPLILALIIGVVVIAGVIEYRNAQQGKEARAASASFVAAGRAVEDGNTQNAIDQYLALSALAPEGYAGRSLDIIAGLELERGNKELAVTYYDKASQRYADAIHKDLSAYKAALIVMDIGRYDDAKARASALDYDSAPYGDLAKELVAQADLITGKADTAKTKFSMLTNLPGVQNGVKIRAGQALALINAKSDVKLPEDTEVPAPEPAQPQKQEE